MEHPAVCEELILVVCEQSASENVLSRIQEAGVSRYTLLHGALGTGETGRHEGTSIWPGENTVIFCCLPEGQVEGLLSVLKAIHDSRAAHTLGIKVFAFPVRELL